MPDPTNNVTWESNDEILWHKPEEHIPVYHKEVNPNFHPTMSKPAAWQGLPVLLYIIIGLIFVTSVALLLQSSNVGDIRSRAKTPISTLTPTPTWAQTNQ